MYQVTSDIIKELDGAFERALLTAVNKDEDEDRRRFILKAFDGTFDYDGALLNAIDKIVGTGIADARAYKTSLEALTVRTIYRHENGMGTVIEFSAFGVNKRLFVADQKYRFIYKYSCQFNGDELDTSHAIDITQDIMLDGFVPKEHPFYKTGDDDWAQNFYQHLNGDSDKDLNYNRDDNWIQTTYPALGNDGTAQQNTDNLVSIGLKPAEQVREITIGDLGNMDIPNLFEAIIIYLEYDKLYSMDPTVTGKKRRPCMVTSSVTKKSKYYDPRPILLGLNGQFHDIHESGTDFVFSEFIPVKEID